MDKELWKNGNHFSTAFFMTYSDGKFPAMRPLEVAGELDSQGVEDD